MLFTHHIAFHPQDPRPAFGQLPTSPAVFCLRGETGEPYLNRTSNLRRRITRLLTPAPAQSRRLALARLVRHIEWTATASDFSAQLLLYRASTQNFGDRAAQRLHLRPPFFLRMGMRNRFPRVWITNAITLSTSHDLFGPFPSRHAAERYAEQVLDLHLLRRCFQDLEPDPEFPGCIYSEMKKCLAPCYGGCSGERYDQEAAAVHAFLRSGGQSLLSALVEERDRASQVLDFETAASVHARHEKVEAVAALAADLARSLSAQHAVLIQPSVPSSDRPDAVDLYLLRGGNFTGPVACSLHGMRLPNEQSGSSSLFAHPAAFAPVPLQTSSAEDAAPQTPDDRLRRSIEQLEADRRSASKQELSDHQALLARWYFRPQAKREGELVTAQPGYSDLPLKALLRACARVSRQAAANTPADQPSIERPTSQAIDPEESPGVTQLPNHRSS